MRLSQPRRPFPSLRSGCRACRAGTGITGSRLGVDRRWRGPAVAQDAGGRSLWALGTAAARGPTGGIRQQARALFDASAAEGSPYPQAMAFAALGAAEILGRWPGHPSRSRCSLSPAPSSASRADAAWPWPAPRLSYANAAIAEGFIAAGEKLSRAHVLRNGLRARLAAGR